MSLVLTVTLGLAALVTLAWALLAARIVRLATRPSFGFVEAIDGAIPGSSSTVTAIIPARNEEANVEATIQALRAQEYLGLSMIVVDDQSTDATATILERLSNENYSMTPLSFVRGIERPAGWVGKTWAVHQGACQATSEWLWFVDADMGLHPSALATAMAAAEAHGADLVSLLPGVRCETFWQGAVASALVQLLGQLYPLDRVNDPGRPEAIAAGGFLLVKTSVYQRAGGHEAVRSEIIEDIRLATRVKQTGGTLFVRLAPSLVWTHMYGSLADIWRGLRKNAYAGMDYQFHKFAVGALVALALAWVPWISIGLGVATGDRLLAAAGSLGVLAQVLATIPVLVFLKLPYTYALALPAGISAYVAIATNGVWHHHRGRVLWKGRAIPASVVQPGTSKILPERAREEFGK